MAGDTASVRRKENDMKPRFLSRSLPKSLSKSAAASSVSLRIVAAMSAICVFGGVLLVACVLVSSRHEFAEDGIARKTVLPASYDAWVIDRDRAIAFVIAFVVCAVIASGLVGWYFSRKQLIPMEEVIQLQRHFVADASHELKTPLAVISLRIDTLEWHLSQEPGGKSRNSDAVSDDLRALRNDVDGMDAVVNDLLSATQSAASGETSNVAAAMRKAAVAVEPLGAAGGVSIHVEVPAAGERVSVSGGEVGLVRCFVALLDNAVAHSPQEAGVDISLEISGSQSIVRVRDHGTGIRGDPEKLFSRFVREDSGAAGAAANEAAGAAHHAAHRAAQRRGYGLGLALVRDIARRYGGTVDVERTDEHGTVMRVRLPLAA
jgi:signal transduction histidine kinase